MPVPLPQAEPQWRPATQFANHQLGSRDRAWLLDDGSLTGRLIASHAGQFRVRRLRQEWVTPHPSERRLLAMPLRQRALVREVVLTIDDEPLVFARSLFPVSSLVGELRHLRQLRNRALGAILFRFPQMHRSPFELATIPGDNHYLPEFLRQREAAWGRRSCFDISGRRLMVSEVFLEPFRPWSAVLPVHRSQRGKVSAAILRPKQ
ncbi:chorismate--pyruvate lyase family protein [Parahaliea maris]|uniref:chorismate--pyruvate lyase family protein n=1 Tax=Parahaliea maris TaxID=2716870 RepID=UPI00164FB78E|nr:chorismate lyase [Parahaliea maris]